MLKYLYCNEIFAEVPGEITLGISISGCIIHCRGCHSMELWEDKGTPLTIEELQKLLEKHKGITCLCILGGEHNIDALTELFQYAYQRVKTAWYCGLDMVPKDKLGIMQYLDFLKIGHYDYELGGLTSPITNQRFYNIEHQGDGSYYQHDVTWKFNKQRNKDKTNED